MDLADLEPLAGKAAAVQALKARYEQARTDFHDDIRAAAWAGAAQVDLVRVTGYTRETIRKIAKEQQT